MFEVSNAYLETGIAVAIIVALYLALRHMGHELSNSQHAAEVAFIEQLEHRDDIDAPDENGMTPLQRAIEDDWQEGFQQVVNRRPDPNTRGPGGIKAMHLAARKNDQILIDKLLALGADVNEMDDSGKTPLWMAASTGAMNVIMQLHEEGADLDRAEHNHGLTPLMIAAMHGRIGAVDILLKLGTDGTLRDREDYSAANHALDNLDRNLGAHTDVNEHLREMVLRLQDAEEGKVSRKADAA